MIDLIYSNGTFNTIPDEQADINIDDMRIMIAHPENDLVWFEYELIDIDNPVIGDETVVIASLGRKITSHYYG